jgi:hypothetical protein
MKLENIKYNLDEIIEKIQELKNEVELLKERLG